MIKEFFMYIQHVICIYMQIELVFLSIFYYKFSKQKNVKYYSTFLFLYLYLLNLGVRNQFTRMSINI